MSRRFALLGGLAALGFMFGCALPASGQEECHDFSAFTNCPPDSSICLLGPNPDSCAQDCSTCTPDQDDDLDCVVDEELLNGEDDDADGLIDEDISCLNSCDPMSFECPAGDVPSEALGAPAPVDGLVTLPARVNHWSCGGNPDDLLELVVALEPYALLPNPACGNWNVMVRLEDAVSGAPWFEGPASVVLTRHWESLDSSLVAGSEGNVQVYRYTMRADLSRSEDYATLPQALQVPCNQDQLARPHLFFYGYLDLALDASRPDDRSLYRTSLVLGHTPGRFTHPEDAYNPSLDLCGFADVSRRAINRGDPLAHDDAGWFVVAPAAGFTFSTTAPVLSGDRSFGRIRQVPEGSTAPCPKETKMCESVFEDPGPIGPCAGRVRYRTTSFCGQDTGAAPCPHYNLASMTKCDTVADHRVAFFPVGSWDQTEYPRTSSVSLMEGSMVCLNNFEPYWYGAYSYLPSPDLWLGPPDSLDIIDNQIIQLTGLGEWLIGSLNWMNEGTPNEFFAPRQFRTMYFFSNSNPDIPPLAPCVAAAVVEPASVELCEGSDLILSGADSTVENCCQCGFLEYRWLREDGAAWETLQDWSVESGYTESPGPAMDTRYRLEVRCSNSKTACVDSAEVSVRIDQRFTLEAGEDVRICQGEETLLNPALAGGTAPWLCSWTPPDGLTDPDACSTTAAPSTTTAYTLDVTDGAGACSARDALTVTVDPLPVADAGGPGPVEAPVQIGSAPCDLGLLYLWDPTDGLMPPDACDPMADPPVPTEYCLVTRDIITGCLSQPDCVTVNMPLCDPAEIPAAIALLRSIKLDEDVHMEWVRDDLATGGYRIYRTELAPDIPQSKVVGLLAVTTPPGAGNTTGDDPGAVPPTDGPLFFYQVTGVCGDGVSEGPL